MRKLLRYLAFFAVLLGSVGLAVLDGSLLHRLAVAVPPGVIFLFIGLILLGSGYLLLRDV